MKQETLGQVFKRYRQADNIKIEQVENDTNISQRMLLALENDDYEKLPDDLYSKNIIKTYAKYLGLDYNKLLTLYDKDKDQQGDKQKIFEKKKEVKVFLTPNRVRNSLIIIIVIILLTYFGFQISRIFRPPELIIYEPSQNLVTQANFIEIKGKTEKEARVFINEKEVFLDQQGEFKATLDLQKGLNLIKISAVKKHSKENLVFREVLVQ